MVSTENNDIENEDRSISSYYDADLMVHPHFVYLALPVPFRPSQHPLQRTSTSILLLDLHCSTPVLLDIQQQT
jgi:hypothetical protein